jgi:hypothetical protein
MGVESWVDAPAAGKRQAKRNRVLLAARLSCGSIELEVRLRDLSRKGALIEGDTVPPKNAEVLFSRGSISVPARVAWSTAKRAGLKFAYMIDESDVLVQLRRTPVDQNTPRFRRPGLGEEMSATDRRVAKLWSASVGIAVPGA